MSSPEETSFLFRGIQMHIKRAIQGDCWLSLPATSPDDPQKLKDISRSMGLHLAFTNINGIPVSPISSRVYYNLLAHARISNYLEGKNQ